MHDELLTTPRPGARRCMQCGNYRDETDLFAHSKAEICLLCERSSSYPPVAVEPPENNETDTRDLDPVGVPKSDNAAAPHSDTLNWIMDVSDSSNGEYEAFGSFINSLSKTRVIHLNCGYEYDVTPLEWRCGQRCWRCHARDDATEDDWRKEVDSDLDRYVATGKSKAFSDRERIRHEVCLTEFEMTRQDWRDGQRCYNCPPIRGRMYKTRSWRREVDEGTSGEYRAISEYKGVKGRSGEQGKVRLIHLICGFEWEVKPGNWRAHRSRCPQCAEGTGDNDAIYVWRTPDRHTDGRIIVKVGTTSWRLKHKRIKKVAWRHNTKAEVLAFERVQTGMATEIEAKVLRIGEPLANSVRADGHTEFRLVDDDELDRMMRLVESTRVY